jgi:type I restriction enzyme S subunit
VSWPMVKLGDVCQFVRGPFGGSLKKDFFVEDGYAVYEQQHAIYNQFDNIRYFVDEEKFEEMKRFELCSGDLIMSCSGTMGRIAIVPEGIKKGIINQALLKLTPKPKVDLHFFKYWMESELFQIILNGNTHGAAIKNVASVAVLKDLEIPLPPLAEQKRIAAILDKADSLRRKNQQAIQLADQFLRAVFLDMFGDPVTNPKGWEVKQLSQLCSEKMNNGIFKQNEEYGEGIPVAWVSELFGTHQITFSTKPKCLKVTNEELDKYGMYFGDILFCRSSLKLEGIGWNNVYLGENLKALFECHLIRMRPNLNVINPIFLSFQLRYPGIRMRCFAQAKTVTMTTINQEGLGKVEVVVPNKALQDRFEIIYRKSIKVLNLLNENQNTNFLFNSLSQKAFAGEL